MLYLDDSKVRIIAFHLVKSKNQKANNKLRQKNIGWKRFYQCSVEQLQSFGFTPKEVAHIKTDYRRIAEKEVGCAQDHGVEVIFKGEEFYPESLKNIYDPPDYIYVKGDKRILLTDTLAVVGSRKGTAYGLNSLKRILPQLVKNKITVVSGMAYGIDSMAHQITVHQNGKTIGVNAGGLDHPYPAGNRSLIYKILDNGCIISEFPLGISPRPFYFPIRNRIIAGISKAILVVEAELKSGSLITARLGLEQNRDIFAIPGRIDSTLSDGTNFLIQQGAKLITSAKDILEEFGISWHPPKEDKRVFLSKKEKKILDLLQDNELKSIDYFVEVLDFSTSAIISIIMGLVLKGLIIEESGGYRKVQ